MWQELRDALRARSGTVQVRWVKAHVSVQEFVSRAIPYSWVLGNEIADALARRGAALVAVNEIRQREIAFVDALAWKVRSRIAAATIEAARASPVIAR